MAVLAQHDTSGLSADADRTREDSLFHVVRSGLGAEQATRRRKAHMFSASQASTLASWYTVGPARLRRQHGVAHDLLPGSQTNRIFRDRVAQSCAVENWGGHCSLALESGQANCSMSSRAGCRKRRRERRIFRGERFYCLACRLVRKHYRLIIAKLLQR